MIIKTDKEGKKTIEDLCHSAMISTARENFIGNLVAINQILISIELLPEEKPIAQDPAIIPQTNESLEELKAGC